MWGVVLIAFYVATEVTSHEIQVECSETNDLPPVSDTPPSVLADLRVALVTVGGKYKMNISWAINIDGSIKYLTGTRINIQGESIYHCKYNPVLSNASLSESEQKWFHYLVKGSYDANFIQVANIPLHPPETPSYKHTYIEIPTQRVTTKHTTVPTGVTTKHTTVPMVLITTLAMKKEAVPDKVNFVSIVVAIFGGLGGLMILCSCFIIYKSCGANVATLLDFKRLPTSPMACVPVLVVYPAENTAFQRAVLALAEFLQWHGGCSVAVDMWQQRKIAELGPMRWLAEKAQAAHRVLIVCPQIEIPSSQPGDSPHDHAFPEPSIPAAAHDLYLLILNMVASQAKSASDLAKFWVVQLGEQQGKNPCNLALELSACKTFCLMKDLKKLCKNLHTQSQDNEKMSDLNFSEKSTVALKEAVEKLVFREAEPVKSLVAIV